MANAADPKTSPAFWYDRASPKDRAIYDGHGPWIVEVTDEAEMPPAFRSVYPADKVALILLTMPRKEERRDFRPHL